MRLVILAALVLVACDSSPESPGPTSDRRIIEAVLGEPLPDKPKPGHPVGVLEDEVFADQIVTFDEYERAILEAIRCIREEGFSVDGPLRYPRSGFSGSVGTDPTKFLTWQYPNVENEDESRLVGVEATCRAQWSLRIERVWGEKNAPSETERQRWLENAWACAREKGLNLSEPPTENEAVTAVLHGCRPW